jgi:heme/copper-type cytochrome/quinol oxidase subunit 2
MNVLDIVKGGLLAALLVGQSVYASPSIPGRAGQAQVRDFDVVVERYEFIPSRIEVDQGDHVRITARSADGTHGFAIRKFGVRTEVPRGGDPVTIEFDANRVGTFEIACWQYCGKGHPRMKATLVVNPAGGGKSGSD